MQRQLDMRQQELKSQREDRLMKMIEKAEKSGNTAQAELLSAKLFESLMELTTDQPVTATGVANQRQDAVMNESTTRPMESIVCNFEGASEQQARIDVEASDAENEEASVTEDAVATTVSVKEEPMEDGEMELEAPVEPTEPAAATTASTDESHDSESPRLNETQETTGDQGSETQHEENYQETEPVEPNQVVSVSIYQPIPKKRQSLKSTSLIRATKKLKLDAEDEANVDGKTK